ncbi:putative nucleotidyltransferase [Symbiobacterium terraclitae]|uniref:Nucleotidyltransferase n=1 Tax=Symbiobacterium terraclitae TaxID=557451 RepID=A0ABS4JS03_9FIRM|nr:nucleotidyltransferase domain-containing protein [Symbiobacterium terraclitae]MBP2018305.1 putative nucleotidyltransferase [Symbiobacterium terraclitae]
MEHLEGRVARLWTALAKDSRITGIWLEGSLARGDADRYSDIDLHALVRPDLAPDAVSQLMKELPRILEAAGKVVFLRPGPGNISTGMLEDGTRFDVVLETDADLQRPRGAFRILFERQEGAPEARGGLGGLRRSDALPAPNPTRVASQVTEFWRCLSLLPAVLGRGELVVATQGHALMLGIAGEILMASVGKVRQTGAKRLNVYLPADLRQALEEAIPSGATAQALAAAQLRLARLVQGAGRRCAERYSFAYPEEFEAAVLRYVEDELLRLGLDVASG